MTTSRFERGCQLTVKPADEDDALAIEMSGRIVWFVHYNHVGHAVVELKEMDETRTKRCAFRPADLQVMQ